MMFCKRKRGLCQSKNHCVAETSFKNGKRVRNTRFIFFFRDNLLREVFFKNEKKGMKRETENIKGTQITRSVQSFLWDNPFFNASNIYTMNSTCCKRISLKFPLVFAADNFFRKRETSQRCQ